jgi:ubiquinol-cytochrome c reductase iron-sulfur subunit
MEAAKTLPGDGLSRHDFICITTAAFAAIGAAAALWLLIDQLSPDAKGAHPP